MGDRRVSLNLFFLDQNKNKKLKIKKEGYYWYYHFIKSKNNINKNKGDLPFSETKRDIDERKEIHLSLIFLSRN